MKKILILANNDVGLYKFRKELIQELLDQENEVYISLPNGEFISKLKALGVKFIETDVDRRGINPFTDFKLLITYCKILKRVKPDLLITYTIKPNLYGGIVARFKKIPYAMNITGLGTAFQNKGILKRTIVSLYKIACKKTKIVFFENEENQRVFIKNQIIKEEKTFKLNGAGVNLEDFKFFPLPVDNDEIRFLFIGRIMKEKGIDELLEVAKRIKKEYKNVYFDLIGLEEEKYIKTLKELESQGVVNYYGYQTDVKPFIKKTHCLILPSYHEGMANTLLEAAGMGRPLITSNISGCREAVIDGISGFLIEVKNSNELYKKIIQFIEMTLEEKKTMGYESRNHIEKNFDKEKVVKNTLNVLFDQ